MGDVIRRLIKVNPLIIELQYHETNSDNYAILVHPNPTKGGSMKNSIVSTMFKSLMDENWNVLRFNFRNCGESRGPNQSDESVFLSDLNIVLDWYIEHAGRNRKNFLICGYAFGAKLSLETLMRRPELNGFVVVSPPVHETDFAFLTPCTHDGLIVHAKFDEHANMQQITALYDKIKGQQPETELCLLDDVHTYRHTKEKMYTYIREYLKTRAERIEYTIDREDAFIDEELTDDDIAVNELI